MSGKDILRLLLINYGFCRDIKIKTYTGDGGWIGYDIYARNDDGVEYSQIDCEGLLFHMYEIQNFMMINNIRPRILAGIFSTNHLLSDDGLSEILSMSENRNYCKTSAYD